MPRYGKRNKERDGKREACGVERYILERAFIGFGHQIPHLTLE
mgnify:CR=1 FL=1